MYNSGYLGLQVVPNGHIFQHGKRSQKAQYVLHSSWNVMAHGDAQEGKWRGNWRMEWVASTLHTTSEHGVSSIITADAHTSAASSRLNWRPRWFKWTRSFRRKTKSGFCACAITFQLASTKTVKNKVRMCENYKHAEFKICIQYESCRIPNPFGYTSCIVRNNTGTILAATTLTNQQLP